MSTGKNNCARTGNRSRYLSGCSTATLALLGLIAAAPAFAQAPTLGTVDNFAVLGASGVTNTGPTVLTGTAAHPGNLGVSPSSSITGFFAVDGGPGILTGPGASIHQNDAVAVQAQSDLTTAYNDLAGRPTTVDLTGQDLGGKTLVPGVYNFSSAAQLTGALTLNGLGNPNAVFIFNIGSTLTTASASSILLINAAQGGNVFWRVGSSATLGSGTTFAGDILALASITLTTGASITCGAAWARTGAVTLDTNTISLCDLIVGSGGPVLGPGGAPLLVTLLPPTASDNETSVANGIDTYVSNGGILPLAFLDLFNLTPDQLAAALTQLSGETATGSAPAAAQAMNSFLSLLTSPFSDTSRPFADNDRPFDDRDAPPRVVKALGIAPEGRPPPVHAAFTPLDRAREQGRWGIWSAVYGGQGNAAGDPLQTGSHDRSVRSYGYATGLDYRINDNTVAGFALAGGGTRFGLSDGLGSGRSDMFQAAVYSTTRVNAAYASAALAYAWHDMSTGRFVTVAGTDHLVADYSAHNVGARIEGGYRYALPSQPGWRSRSGYTPYAAAQVQVFRTPSYSETAASGSAIFALAYDARTTTTARTELGAWYDWRAQIDHNTVVSLRSRLAWAHDFWSSPDVTASFIALPGSSFVVTGARPDSDLLLASVSAETFLRNGYSFAVRLDSEFGENTQRYSATGRLRYTW
jgi:uncharacterized protein with beta-barrel porin domain